MKKLLWLLAIPLALLGWWAYHRNNDAPQVPFAKVMRETLVSTLPTNGKVEPIEWQAVRVEQAGLVGKTPVQEGQTVSAGAALAILSDTGLQADLEAAEVRVAQARADCKLPRTFSSRAFSARRENWRVSITFRRDFNLSRYFWSSNAASGSCADD